MNTKLINWKKHWKHALAVTILSSAALVGIYTLASDVQISNDPIDTSIVSKFMIDQDVITNIRKLNDLGLESGKAATQPWASSFLPAKLGYAADPFADRLGTYSSQIDLPGGYAWYMNNRMPKQSTLFKTLSVEKINKLSAAEKYDLLIGTFGQETSVSANLWKQAITIKKQSGMSFWTGMCHGWSPASIAVPRPENAIQVKSTLYHIDGKDYQYDITFYPDEIKELATVLWANTSGWDSQSTWEMNDIDQASGKRGIDKWGEKGVIPMLGRRCNKSHPKRDKVGHVIGVQFFNPSDRLPLATEAEATATSCDPNSEGCYKNVIKRPTEEQKMKYLADNECDDLDPALFHLITVNHVGRKHHSMVLDVDYNAPVNNHPLSNYSYTYFDPKTGETGTYENSVRNVEDFNDDVLARYRTHGVSQIVGVKMSVNVTNWRPLTQNDTDSELNDKLLKKVFIYDLELDSSGNVIGGEWRGDMKNRVTPFFGIRGKTNHPDFIWWPSDQVQPYTGGEGQWSLNGNVFPEGKTMEDLASRDTFPASAWTESDRQFIDWSSPDQGFPFEWRTSALQSAQVKGTNYGAKVMNPEDRKKECPWLDPVKDADKTCFAQYQTPQVLRSVVDRLVEWSRMGSKYSSGNSSSSTK